MKKIRLSILLITCILLSGCSVDYTLKIDENLKFSESVNITENNSFFQLYNQSPKEYIESNKKFYEEDDIYGKFKYNVKYNSDSTEISTNGKDMDIDLFNNDSIIYGTLFSSINATNENGKLVIKTTDYNGKNFFRKPFTAEDPTYNDATFTIKTPLELISTNADIVDEQNGKYTWKYSANSTNNKNIEIVLNTNIEFSKRMLLILKKYWFIPVIAILLMFGIIKISVMRKINNKI